MQATLSQNTDGKWSCTAYLIQVVSLAGVRQEICWLPAFVYWLQQWQDPLTHVPLKAVYQLQPLLAKAV